MLVCVFLCSFAHETAGAACTRSSLRPPYSGGATFLQTSGEPRRGNANARLKRRHCEERSDEAIHSLFAWRDGLLPPSLFELRRTSRCARNDAESAFTPSAASP